MPDYLPIDAPHTHENPIPPRFQWNHNGGYCGETSFIAAGLYFGQYLSQYDLRSIASPGKKQNAMGKQGDQPYYSSQLLLGVNDTKTANRLRLKHEEWPRDKPKNTKKFIQWVKEHVLKGHPVIIGVFNNFNLLGEGTSPLDGDSQYDHIVPVLGFGTNNKKDFDNQDIIVLSDNGLYTPGNSVPFYHQFRMKPKQAVVAANPFLGQRRAANNINGNIYSVLKLTGHETGAKKGLRNYAIAITGVKHGKDKTMPVRITTDLNYEIPSIGSDSNKRPKSRNIKLSITVSNLSKNTKYYLYQYDDETKVPTSDFNKNKSNACHKYTIQESTKDTFEMSLTIKSSDKVFFRAVPASAK